MTANATTMTAVTVRMTAGVRCRRTESMTLTEKFIADAILLDSGAEVMYGRNEVFDTYPCRFPTVEFQLIATDALVEIADRIRLDKGYKPMHPRDSMTDDVDNDGWYDFYVGVSKLPGNHQQCQLDSSISFVVVNSDSDDNEDPVSEFNEMHWISMLDRVMVYSKERIVFEFKDGTEIVMSVKSAQ